MNKKKISLIMILCFFVAASSVSAIFTDVYRKKLKADAGTLILDHELSLDGEMLGEDDNGVLFDFGKVYEVNVKINNTGTLDARLQAYLRLEFPASVGNVDGLYLYDQNASPGEIEMNPHNGNMLSGGQIATVGTNIVYEYLLPSPSGSTEDQINVGQALSYKAYISFSVSAPEHSQRVRGNVYSVVSGVQARNSGGHAIVAPTHKPGNFIDDLLTGIELDQNYISINGLVRGAKLRATLTPKNAENQIVSWSSDNTSVATVDTNGTVVSRRPGVATITAKNGAGHTATCVVEVRE